MHMEKPSQINLEGLYQQIKEEEPLPWAAQCTKCGRKIITEARATYRPEKHSTIKLYRPAHCPECITPGKPQAQIFAAIDQYGKIHPRKKQR